LETVTGTGMPELTSMAVSANKLNDSDSDEDEKDGTPSPPYMRRKSQKTVDRQWEARDADRPKGDDKEEDAPAAKVETEEELGPTRKEKSFRLLGALPDFSPPSMHGMGQNNTYTPGSRRSARWSSPDSSSGKRTSPKSKKQPKLLKNPRKRAKNVPEDVPDAFICAVSGCFMRSPVLSPYGHTYDKRSIRSWLKKYGRKCPFTGLPLSRSELTPALELSRDIENFRRSRSDKSTPTRGLTPQRSLTMHDSAAGSSKVDVRQGRSNEDDLYDFT